MAYLLAEPQVSALARILAAEGSGDDIAQTLSAMGLRNYYQGYSKRQIIYGVFTDQQTLDGNSHAFLDFIKRYLHPVMYAQAPERFETVRNDVNRVLGFSGLEYSPSGEFVERPVATSLEQESQNEDQIGAKLKVLDLHPEVLKYCQPELEQGNYFHAVFEANKGLAQRIREESQINHLDGVQLVQQAFSEKKPLLAFNSLQTDTEKSEHRGLFHLLSGAFEMVRNPMAHTPQALWEWQNEDEAIAYLVLLSLLHGKLDKCRRVPR